jgi:hypothetical protein
VLLRKKLLGIRGFTVGLAMTVAVILVFAATSHAGGHGPVDVSAKQGWQSTPVTLQKGGDYVVDYLSGKWTVDYRNFPYVGPQGYPPDIDKQIYQGCKIGSQWSYGKLLAIVGQGSTWSPIVKIGRGTPYHSHNAPVSGRLYLRINDADRCLRDNRGSVRMKVYIGI